MYIRCPRVTGISDIYSVDFKIAIDEWLLCASYSPAPFEREGPLQLFCLCFSIICWVWVEEMFFVFHSCISEAKVLHPKNCTWRNLFLPEPNLDKEILVLKPGPDAVVEWILGERGKCILPEGKNYCG